MMQLRGWASNTEMHGNEYQPFGLPPATSIYLEGCCVAAVEHGTTCAFALRLPTTFFRGHQ